MTILRPFLAALLSCAALSAQAGDAPAVQDMPVQQILAYHDDVARRARTKDFEALSRGDRQALAKAQDELRRALDGKASMAELDEASRTSAIAAHELVVALVAKAEDERMVCVQKKRLGSHRHQLECRTAAQIKADREAARNARLRGAVCDPSTGCGGN